MHLPSPKGPYHGVHSSVDILTHGSCRISGASPRRNPLPSHLKGISTLLSGLADRPQHASFAKSLCVGFLALTIKKLLKQNPSIKIRVAGLSNPTWQGIGKHPYVVCRKQSEVRGWKEFGDNENKSMSYRTWKDGVSQCRRIESCEYGVQWSQLFSLSSFKLLMSHCELTAPTSNIFCSPWGPFFCVATGSLLLWYVLSWVEGTTHTMSHGNYSHNPFPIHCQTLTVEMIVASVTLILSSTSTRQTIGSLLFYIHCVWPL